MARSRRTLPVLAENSIIQRGTEIEVIPDARPENANAIDQRIFRARIENPQGLKESVVWEYDQQPYSLSGLTDKLYDEHGVVCLVHYYFKHWRIVGHTVTLWDEAEQFQR